MSLQKRVRRNTTGKQTAPPGIKSNCAAAEKLFYNYVVVGGKKIALCTVYVYFSLSVLAYALV